MLPAAVLAPLSVFGCAGGPAAAPVAPPADLVIVADRVIEVEDGRIRAIHDPAGDAPVALGPDTEILRGDRVTAGFVDAHAHPDGLGAQIAELDLGGAATYAEALERVRGATPVDGWLVGRGWDHERWPDAPAGGWPLAADLDAAHPGVSVRLERVDGHAVWASTAALQGAGIGGDTPDPPGGRIVRDPQGRPTGVVVDRAAERIVPPAPSRAEEVRRLQAALVRIAAVGLTGVHAMAVSDGTLSILEELAADGRLPVRVWAYVTPDSQAAAQVLASGPSHHGRLTVVGIKAFADGALGSRGALLSAPYADAGESGTEVTEAARLARLAVEARQAGIGLAVHAIGDLAVTRTLDAFAAAPPPRRGAPPLRIEHAQVVRPEDRPRFAALDVIASMQPTHATSDRPWVADRLGEARVPWAYAWRSLSDAGATLAFGSDVPVEDVDPAFGLVSAVERGGWTVSEALTVDEAVAAFTVGPARAVGEVGLGVLEIGAVADLTLWKTGGSPWRAVATVVGGEVVAAAPIAR